MKYKEDAFFAGGEPDSYEDDKAKRRDKHEKKQRKHKDNAKRCFDDDEDYED
jgi:hypothetical protein